MSVARTAQWIVLDVPGRPGIADKLQAFAPVSAHALFADTDLHALRAHGPCVVELAAQGALAEGVHEQPQEWPGLLLQATVSTACLLEHLRRMLTVTFGLHYKGLLSYYNPCTASYFFDACDARELSRWMGPIEKLYWYGGTWADHATGSLGWQQLVNPRLEVEPLAIEDCLSLQQQGRLQAGMLEQHAWRWSRSTGRDYEVIWNSLAQGIELGFSQRAVLDGWLRLRLQYPSAEPEEPLPGRTQQERLDSLRQRWRNGQP